MINALFMDPFSFFFEYQLYFISLLSWIVMGKLETFTYYVVIFGKANLYELVLKTGIYIIS